MRRNRIINLILVLAILTVSILPILLFRSSLQITKLSIPAICILAFHLLYGFAAYCFRHKGNFLRFNFLFLRHFIFNFVEPNEDYTYTKEYKKNFYRMFAIYLCVIPMYIPCIFIPFTLSYIPALVIFLIPQILFVFVELQDYLSTIKKAKEETLKHEQEREIQEKKEETGSWK